MRPRQGVPVRHITQRAGVTTEGAFFFFLLSNQFSRYFIRKITVAVTAQLERCWISPLREFLGIQSDEWSFIFNGSRKVRKV